VIVAVPTQLPETDYTLTYAYTAGIGACTLTEQYGKILPRKIDLNLEPISIVDAKLDVAYSRVDRQIEQNAATEVDLFFAQSYLWQWLATAPSALNHGSCREYPKKY
jgi:hypothetical protein